MDLLLALTLSIVPEVGVDKRPFNCRVPDSDGPLGSVAVARRLFPFLVLPSWWSTDDDRLRVPRVKPDLGTRPLGRLGSSIDDRSDFRGRPTGRLVGGAEEAGAVTSLRGRPRGRLRAGGGALGSDARGIGATLRGRPLGRLVGPVEVDCSD